MSGRGKDELAFTPGAGGGDDEFADFTAERDAAREAAAKRKRVALIAVVGVALIGAAVALWPAPAPPTGPVDLSPQWGHIAPFEELHAIGVSWIAVLPHGWGGDAAAACAQLYSEAAVQPPATVTFMDSEGVVLVECGG